jgi:hypothetical protein
MPRFLKDAPQHASDRDFIVNDEDSRQDYPLAEVGLRYRATPHRLSLQQWVSAIGRVSGGTALVDIFHASDVPIGIGKGDTSLDIEAVQPFQHHDPAIRFLIVGS